MTLDEYHNNPAHGILALEYNVLVYVEEVGEKTTGGVLLPDEVKARDQNAATMGMVVGISPMAFKNRDWPEDVEFPKVGDFVYFGRYAGASSRIKGRDGKQYQMIKDQDIMSVIRGEDE